MKRYITVLILLLGSYLSATTVTGTIQDINGNRYSNGTVSAFNLITGASMTPGATDANGSFSITLSPSTYLFTVCARPVNIGPSTSTSVTQVCSQPATPIVISGGSQDVSTQINAVAPILGPSVAALLAANNAFTGNNTHAGLETFNGGGSLSGTWGGSPLVTGNWIFTGSDTFSKINNRVYIDGTKYPFSSAGIQAAHDGADCPAAGCIIDIGPNSFNLTSAVTFTKEVCLVGAGIPATILTYTPATGTAFNFSPSGFRACFMGIQLTTSTSTSSVGVQFTYVSEGLIFNSMIHGFFGGIRATGDGVSQNSTGIRISQVLVDFNCGAGGYDLSLDHAQDVFIDAFRFYQTGGGAGACITSNGMIIDRGSQGLWMRDGTLENGLHSAVIQNTSLGGAYGTSPAAIFATSVTFDNAGGGTNLLFDSSLGTSATRFYCNGCWFAAGGQGSSPVNTAMGFDIEGGSDINFIGGVCRFNRSWCGKINSAGSAFEVTEMQVYDNNQGNTAGVGGFLITASPVNWSIKNLPSCGNKGIDTPTGNQYYCVDYSAAASGSGTAYGNNATNNINGPNNIGAAATTGLPAPYFLVDDIFPALSGGLRLSEAKAQVKSKNHAVSGDTVLVAKNSGDDKVQLGDTAGVFTLGPLTLSTVVSNTANPATTGFSRAASTDQHCWRNNANSADVCISKDATDNLLWNSLGLTGSWSCANVTPVTVNTSTTADQNTMACTIPASTLNRVGRSLRIATSGVYSTPAASTAQMTAKIKLCTVSGCGSGTVLTLVNIQSTALGTVQITNDNWGLSALSSTQTAGATASFESHGDFLIDLSTLTTAADSAFGDTNTATIGTIDTTAQLFLQVTFAFSAASASNTSTERQLIVETIN